MTVPNPIAPPVAIIGAGPAGMSAAMWLRTLQIPSRWLCADDELGGTLRRVGNPIANYAGRVTDSGRELARILADELPDGLRPELGVHVDEVVGHEDHVELRIGEETLRFGAVIVATGTRPRFLGLDGEQELRGDGVEISVTATRDRYAGDRVVIVGGGDAALEGALLLAEVCPHVTIVHRRKHFRGQERFQARVRARPNVHLRMDNEVTALLRSDNGDLRGVRLRDGNELDAAGLFVRIGVEAAVPTGIPDAARGPHAYLDVDLDGATRVPRIFAVGDVATATHQSVAWAVGSAARAAEAVQRMLGLKDDPEARSD